MRIHEGRHPATVGILQWFNAEHLSPPLRKIADPIAELADDLVYQLPDGPELTAGLRKLLEAKDCFVRAKLEQLS